MAKHSKYEPAERELIIAQYDKLQEALFENKIKWPKGVPYSDVGEEWFDLMSHINMEIDDFEEKWHLIPCEEDD